MSSLVAMMVLIDVILPFASEVCLLLFDGRASMENVFSVEDGGISCMHYFIEGNYTVTCMSHRVS
jgi:hypothetical protein